jgi:hypothetical protein
VEAGEVVDKEQGNARTPTIPSLLFETKPSNRIQSANTFLENRDVIKEMDERKIQRLHDFRVPRKSAAEEDSMFHNRWPLSSVKTIGQNSEDSSE